MPRDPQPGAIVITRNDGDVFALCDSSGVPQIVCDTFQELLQLAVHFARDKHQRLWYAGDDGLYNPVGDAVLLQRIWSEFVDHPSRHLTPEQARLLCGVDSTACVAALEALVALRLASHNGDGEYAAIAAST